MNAERRVSNSNRIELGHIVRMGFRYYWGAVTLLTVGLVLSILASSVLPMGSVSAAAPIEDVPCTECARASDPVQYTFLAAGAAAERGAGVVSAAGLPVGDASDPVQYTFLAARAAEEGEIGAVSAAGLAIGDASDPVQYTFVAALVAEDRETDCAMPVLLTRARTAEAARLTGLAEWHLGGEFAVAGAPRLDRARSAEAARLTALAVYLGMGPGEVSPALACLAGL